MNQNICHVAIKDWWPARRHDVTVSDHFSRSRSEAMWPVLWQLWPTLNCKRTLSAQRRGKRGWSDGGVDKVIPLLASAHKLHVRRFGAHLTSGWMPGARVLCNVLHGERVLCTHTTDRVQISNGLACHPDRCTEHPHRWRRARRRDFLQLCNTKAGVLDGARI